MKIPKKLKVEGHEFRVTFCKKVIPGEDTSESETMAMVDKENLQIKLKKGMKRSVVEESFFHEMVHLCENEMEPLKEEIIDDLARRLYAILKNNKMLRAR